MKSFEFFQDTKLVFGPGRVKEIGEITKAYGNTCLLVSTPVIDPLKPMYERIRSYLEKSGLKVDHFDGVDPNPTTDNITEGANRAKALGADVIIGVGGGSSMDSAKAIAVEASHEGTAWDYLFYKKQPTEKTLPVIAVSTTSGTGSQVTQVAVVSHAEKRDKSALFNTLLYPRVSIIDPELMVTLPEFVTACTGFDAFCHAFESMIHPASGAYINLLAKEAVQIVANNLPAVLENPNDIELRSRMAWADTLAGLCIANAGVTLPHGMGMAIGGMYPKVAHGEALAIVYPACTEFTWQSAIEEYAFMARTFGDGLDGLSDEEAASKSSEIIATFLERIGINQRLNDVDMPENEIEALAKQSMVLPDYENNPKVATFDEMVSLVKSSY